MELMSRGCKDWSWVVLVHYRVLLHALVLEMQNFRAVRCQYWSVRITAVQYWRCRTFGLFAASAGPSELQPYSTGGAEPSGCSLPVLVCQLQPWKVHGFDQEVSVFSLRIWRDVEEELLVCLKACLFIRVHKQKEITKNVNETSQLLAHVCNCWFYCRQRYRVFLFCPASGLAIRRTQRSVLWVTGAVRGVVLD